MPITRTDPQRGDEVPPLLDDDFLAVNVYAAYPHSNGFLPDGTRMVVGDAGRPALRLLALEPGTGATEPLLDLSDDASDDAILWFDVALDVPLLATTCGGRILAVDLTDGSVRTVHRADADARIDGIVAISPDGTRIAAIEHRGRSNDRSAHSVQIIDVATGRVEERLRVPWWANHVQLSPADPAWIGFAHEGPADAVTDRVWALHPELAPAGRVLADQQALSTDPARPLEIGHERWMLHRPGAIAVAYGDGPQPRGIWELPVDAAPRLISPGERDWHCGISRDGSRIVVDTTGPVGTEGSGWQDAGNASSIVVIDAATGARTVIGQTRFTEHPFHPHPAFTPDGRHVIHNHIAHDGRRGVALREVPA